MGFVSSQTRSELVEVSYLLEESCSMGIPKVYIEIFVIIATATSWTNILNTEILIYNFRKRVQCLRFMVLLKKGSRKSKCLLITSTHPFCSLRQNFGKHDKKL